MDALNENGRISGYKIINLMTPAQYLRSINHGYWFSYEYVNILGGASVPINTFWGPCTRSLSAFYAIECKQIKEVQVIY